VPSRSLGPVLLRLSLLSLHLDTVSQLAQVVMKRGGLLEAALKKEASFWGRVAGWLTKSRQLVELVIMLEGALEKRVKNFEGLEEGVNKAEKDAGPYFVPPRTVFSYQPPGRFDQAWRLFRANKRIIITGAAGVVRFCSSDTAVPPAPLP